MCEILLAIWPTPQPLDRFLPWGLELERMGVGGFGWGLAWRAGSGVHRYRRPVRLSDDLQGQAELEGVSSTHYLLHLRRPSRLSTVQPADTQPFVSDDGGFAFAHNGRLEEAAGMRSRFSGLLQGDADSEVGFRLFEALLGEGRDPAEALPQVHAQLGGSANLAFLPARGDPLFYAGNDQNDGWRFRLEGAELASTALHSADEAIFSMVFPAARERTRIGAKELVAILPSPAAVAAAQLSVEAG